MITADKFMSRIDTLPPLPDTVLRLIRVTNDPNGTIQDVVESIRYDPSVTAELLKVCNSPYWGLPRTVSSLPEAVRYLGILKVLHLVLSIHTSSMMGGRQGGYELAPGMLWRHSVAVALGSACFADTLGLPVKNLAFTAGLLHDIGKIVIHEFVGEDYAEIVRCVQERRVSFCDAEREVLGCSHETVGAEVAARWKLPEIIVDCIRHHHHPGEVTPAEPLIDVVYLADCLALMLGVGVGSDELLYRADPEILRRHNLTHTDLERAGVQMLTELVLIEQIFAGGDTGIRPRPVGS